MTTFTSDIGPWAAIPRWLIRHKVSDGAVRLYAAIADRADRETSSWKMRQDVLVDDLNVTRSTIVRNTKALEKIGALVVERSHRDRSGGEPNRYHVILVEATAARVVEFRQANPGLKPAELGRAILTHLSFPGSTSRACDDPPPDPHVAESAHGHVAESAHGHVAESAHGHVAESAHGSCSRNRAQVIKNPLSEPSQEPPGPVESDGPPSLPGPATEATTEQRAKPKPGDRKRPTPDSDEAERIQRAAERIERDLARRSAEHFALPVMKATKDNVAAVRLLITNGQGSWETPRPVPVEEVERVIELLFTEGAVKRGGFSWADQIRSGVNLRAKWDKLVTAPWARKRPQMNRDQRMLHNMGMAQCP